MKYLFNELGRRFLPINDFSFKYKYNDKYKDPYKDVQLRGKKFNNSKSYTRMMEREGGTFLVKFYKVDGTIRTMLCTRDWKALKRNGNQGFIPPSGTGSRRIPAHQVIVWDTQAKGFRSFRANTVIGFERVGDGIVESWNPSIKISIGKLIDLLDNGDYEIVFYKSNGFRRVMRCTRNLGGFKDAYPNSNKIICVWDYDKQDYRAINYDRIKSYKKINYPTYKDFSLRLNKLFS